MADTRELSECVDGTTITWNNATEKMSATTTANELATNTSSVTVSDSDSPTVGQALIAISPVAAMWQDLPESGGGGLELSPGGIVSTTSSVPAGFIYLVDAGESSTAITINTTDDFAIKTLNVAGANTVSINPDGETIEHQDGTFSTDPFIITSSNTYEEFIWDAANSRWRRKVNTPSLGGDLSGSAEAASVVAITDSSSTSFPIGSLAEGEFLMVDGGELVTAEVGGPHASSHENGGDDEISLAGLSVQNCTGFPAPDSSNARLYLNGPALLPVGPQNANLVNSLSNYANTGAEQTAGGLVAAGATNLVSAFYFDYASRAGFVPPGTWTFTTYANVDSVTGTSQVISQVYKALSNSGVALAFPQTVTITGSGTSRTATASGFSPFQLDRITPSTDKTVGSYLQTEAGLYLITARTSNTVVTISTPASYTNETAVSYTTWTKLFAVTSDPITTIAPAFERSTIQVIKQSFTLDGDLDAAARCKLGAIVFAAASGAATDIRIAYDGTTHHSVIATPLNVEFAAGLLLDRFGKIQAAGSASAPAAGSVLTIQPDGLASFTPNLPQTLYPGNLLANSLAQPGYGLSGKWATPSEAEWLPSVLIDDPVAGVRTSSGSAVAQEYVRVNATGAGADITISLPTTHVLGEKVALKCVGDADLGFHIYLDGNGSTINGHAGSYYTVDTVEADALLVRSDGSNWFIVSGRGDGVVGGGPTPDFVFTAIQTANYTANAGECVLCDTTSGGFTVFLPASPSDLDQVRIKAPNALFGSSLTVDANGALFENGASTLSYQSDWYPWNLSSISKATAHLQYSSAVGRWLVI